MQVACRGVTRICFSHQPAFTFSSGAAFFAERKMVGVTGFEPVTLRLSSACSNQLSYTPNRSSERVSARPFERADSHAFTLYALALPRSLVELRRLELLTYSLQSYRSTN